jgi:RNA polymerase sigma-70 factor (ECF subfamily)
MHGKFLHPGGGGVRSFIEDAILCTAGQSVMNTSARTEFVRIFRFFAKRPAGYVAIVTKPASEQEIPDQRTDQERDMALFRRIVARDRTAFADFYDRHSTRLYSIAHHILNNADEAQDVLQDVCMQIWEKAATFDPKLGAPSVWAGALVRNKAIDRVRASQRRGRLVEAAAAESALSTEAVDSANESVHGHEKATLIRTAIVELPSEQRHAIELAFFSGLTQAEISEKLCQPLGTIKARIRRGLLKLRERLEGVL